MATENLIPQITQSDLKDPTLANLNKLFGRLADQIARTQGSPNTIFDFGGEVRFPQAFLTNKDVPSSEYALLTKAAADKLYSPEALARQLQTGRFQLNPIGGLPGGTGGSSGGGVVPPPPSYDFRLREYGTSTNVPDSITRDIRNKVSDVWSALDFGALGDGSTDDSDAINNAIVQAGLNGGKVIYFPGGRVYRIETPILWQADNVWFMGDGDSTVFLRGDDMPAGFGVFDIQADNAAMLLFKYMGDVIAPVGLEYGIPGGFNNDPMDPVLTENTAIWIHSGSNGTEIYNYSLVNTGGYAILVDADSANINGVYIAEGRHKNNFPHTFGTNPADLNYGAWTGGILMRGDCRASASKLFSVRNVIIEGMQFERCDGNCIWMHSYGFDEHHYNINVTNNQFNYIGRDAVLVGNVIGFVVADNTARWIGAIVQNDSDTPVMSYLTDHYAVGYDSSGYSINGMIVNNVADEFYGGGFDLDGLRDSVVSCNVASTTQLIGKGFQTGDTSVNGGADNVLLCGNYVKGCNAGGMVLVQAVGCTLVNNMIDHPASPTVQPIVLFSPNKQTYNNVVTSNRIRCTDATFAVIEDDGGSGTGFDSSTVNYVYNNMIFNCTAQFLKNPNSGSTTRYTFASNSSSVAQIEESYIQREGTGSGSSLKFYDTSGASTVQLGQWQRSNGLLNVSLNGAVQTGILATANRTTLGFADALFTGKGLLDGFFAVYDYAGAATSYQAADANALTNDWALLRFNKTAGYFEQSLTTSAGSRVWTALSGGGSISGLTAGRVPFAASPTTITDDAALVWDNTNKRLGVGEATPATRLHVDGVLTVDGTASTTAIAVTDGYVDSNDGFYTGSSNTDSIQAPVGGVTARFLIGTRSFTMTADTAANAGLSGSTQGRIYFDSTSNKFRVSENGGAYVDLVGGSISGLTAGRMPYATAANAIGNTLVYWDNANTRMGVNKATPGTTLHVGGQIYADGATSGAGITCADGYIESTEGFYSPFTSYQTVQAPSGGLYARSLRATVYTQLGNNSSTPSATSGDGFAAGAIYWDTSGTPALKVYNGSTWVTVATGGITAINSMTGPGITINTSGSGININSASNTVTITNTGVTSAAGTTSQVLVNGGTSAQTGAITLSLPQAIATTSQPTFAGVISTVAFNASVTGTTIAFQTANTNFQVNGNGVVAVSSSGAFNVNGSTVIDGSRNVTAVNVTASGNITGSSTSSYFDTSYNSSPGPYRLRGSTLIDNGGVWVSAGGINMNAGCAATGYNIFGGAIGQSASFSVGGVTYGFTNGILTSVL